MMGHEVSVRTILRAILTLSLLLGGGMADWAPVRGEAHESCCCGMAAGLEDACPCPKPEGNRTPTNGPCTGRQAVVASPAAPRRTEQAGLHREPRPEPATWALMEAPRATLGAVPSTRGRDPDLGRHLARLDTLRI